MGKRRCLPNAISKLQVNIVSWRAGHLIFEILKQPRKERRRGKEKKRRKDKNASSLCPLSLPSITFSSINEY
jgi:hypothetical protein